MSELNQKIKDQVDLISLALSKQNHFFTAREVALIAVTHSLQEGSNWLHETLGDSADFRYDLALKLQEQAMLLGQQEDEDGSGN